MSTTVNIGQIPYLNCEPFFNGLNLDGINLCPLVPSAMGPLATTRELDAAPFSLIQSFGLIDEYETLGDMGISVKGAVRSILLYSKIPLKELSGSTIGVTQESATSSQLLRVILETKHDVYPRKYVNLSDKTSSAFLLIGDQALGTHDRVPDFDYRYDLSEEWFEWHKLPFVFARWMVLKSLDTNEKDTLSNKLISNLNRNMAGDLSDIISKRESMNMEPGGIENYLRAFRYIFSEEDQKAIEVFEQAWKGLRNLEETL